MSAPAAEDPDTNLPAPSTSEAGADGAVAPADPPAPHRPPSRAQMRQRMRVALGCTGEEPTTTVEEVMADMYASQYNFERTVTGMMSAMASSKLGRKMIGRVEQQFTDEGEADDAPSSPTE